MDINTNAFGTKGLPVFGQSGIDSGGRREVIADIDKSFTTLLAHVKASMFPGNEAALILFGHNLEQAYWAALKTVAGKPVVNN